MHLHFAICIGIIRQMPFNIFAWWLNGEQETNGANYLIASYLTKCNILAFCSQLAHERLIILTDAHLNKNTKLWPWHKIYCIFIRQKEIVLGDICKRQFWNNSMCTHLYVHMVHIYLLFSSLISLLSKLGPSPSGPDLSNIFKVYKSKRINYATAGKEWHLLYQPKEN